MQVSKWLRLTALCLILAPATARGQFDTLRQVGVPPVGSWAEYQIVTQSSAKRTVTSQRTALVGSTMADGKEYLWFEIQTQTDDFGEQRYDLVYQVAVERTAAETAEDLLLHVREMIVKVADRPAFRIAPDFSQVAIDQGLIGGGRQGAGTTIDYAYRDLADETIETPAGSFVSTHKKGLGEGEVILSLEERKRHAVDSIVDIWYSNQVPFGLVRKVTRTTGKEAIQQPGMKITLDSEETVQLVAFGAGATSAIQGQVFDYDPAIASQLRPPTN